MQGNGRGFIVCERVSRLFESAGGEETQALVDVDLVVNENEFLCLLGPSGCGKTTLLNLIAGFIGPSAGVITVDKTPISSPGADRGVVFQDYSLFSWLTILGNVEFGPRMAGVPAAERRRLAERYLTLVGLDGAHHKYPFELSGGMKQRVAIARSLATNPKVLLMDEPFAALDAITRGDLQEEILRIQRAEKKTIVFVTHNIGEAIFLADRIAVMSARPGRIKEVIDIELPRPRSRTTENFNRLYEHLESAIGSRSVE